MGAAEIVVTVVTAVACLGMGVFLGSLPFKRDELTEWHMKYQQLGGVLGEACWRVSPSCIRPNGSRRCARARQRSAGHRLVDERSTKVKSDVYTRFAPSYP